MKILLLSSIIGVVRSLIIIVPLLLLVAYLTLLERKVLGGMQRRTGPNVVGFSGLLQPFADGLKLLAKETVIPSLANKIIFIIAPIGTFFLSLLGWAVIPLGPAEVLASINIGILYLLAISSLGVYGIIMSGWSSNSKYAFLGGLRSAAQMISYEVSLGLIILSVILCSGSLDLTTIVRTRKDIWYGIPLLSLLTMFFISCLAETNRPPFDLPEAEAELVSGFNVEYAAAGFALFFIGEYVNIILMSTLCAILFLGGGFYTLGLKVLFFVFLFLWVRVAFPRYRYDQLMRLGWKIFLPLSLGLLVGISGQVLLWDSLIINI